MCVRVLPHSSLSRLVQCVCDWVRNVCESVCARPAASRSVSGIRALRSRRERERERAWILLQRFSFFSSPSVALSYTHVWTQTVLYPCYWWSMNELSVTVTTWYNTGFICSGVIHHTLDIPFIFYRPTATSPAGCINYDQRGCLCKNK